MKYIAFAASLLACTLIGYGQSNYYVSPTGNNSNSGSISAPWLTVQYGLDQLISGDTLNLRTGTYNEKIQIPISGITLSNEIGNAPIIDATGLTFQESIIEIYDVSNIIIDGIELQNNIMPDAQGIVVENNCQNITIKNCNIHDIHFSSNASDPVNANTNAQGIIVYGTDGANAITNLNILNNTLHDCRLGYSEGIAVNGNVDGFAVSGNTVYDLTNIGIDLIGFEGTSSSTSNDQARNGTVKDNIVYNCISLYATSGGIYIDGGKSIVVENNISYHNGYGIEIGCENIGEATDDITVRNNIFYDNEVAAISFGGFDYPTGSGKVINSSFRNNTCYYNDYSNQGNGEMYLSYTENCTIENNIFYASTQNVALYQDGTPLNLSLNYNIYYTDAVGIGLEFDYAGSSYNAVMNFSTGTGLDANSSETDPLFVAAGILSPDFHLQVTSPCIDAGNPGYTPSVSEKDMDGETRNNGTVDCGADEYYSASGIRFHAGDRLLKIFPNPTSDHIYIDAYEGKYTIVNAIGELVISGNITDDNKIISIGHLASGTYIFTIENSRSLYAGKIVRK